MSTPRRTLGRLFALPWVLTIALALCTSAGIASAAPRTIGLGGITPVIDGNGDDLISYAATIGDNGCAVNRSDARDDISISDDKIEPCGVKENTNGGTSPDYYINGKDLRQFVFTYDRTTRQVHVLWRAEGIIGDVDGNGNPDNNNCSGGTSASFVDQVGIGSEDSYEVLIDTDCDPQGIIDVTIKISNNVLTVTGASIGTSDFKYRAGAGISGKDLELVINDLTLPDIFKLSAFSGAIRDGLGEDVTPIVSCGDPRPSIDVQKSFSIPVICPGGTADVTIVVRNTGNVDLTDIVVVDNLPTGLTYQSTQTNTCGAAFNQTGNTLTFNGFSLAKGASCTIVVRVGRTAGCDGEQINNVSADGSYQADCFMGGETVIVSANDSASILCGNILCSISGEDLNVCPGELVQLCGPDGPYTYAWTRNSVAYSTEKCITVGAGVYALVIRNTETGCVSDNSCTKTVVEDPLPVCRISADKDAVCATETARLCGPDGPFTYAWTKDGVAFSTDECINVGPGVYALVIRNTETGCVSNNSCTKTIVARTPPCVDVTVNAPDALCAGAAFELCGRVTNCGDTIADLEVRYGDIVRTYPGVPAREWRDYCIPAVMPACTDGSIAFEVIAKASNACGPITKNASDTVQCKVPRIDVEKVARETSVANGGTIHYTITVTNPSATVALEDVIVVDDLCAYAKWTGVASPTPSVAPGVGSAGGLVTWNIGNLAPLASVDITFEVTADIAAGGGVCPTTVQCQNDVYATGKCAGGGADSVPVRDDDSITTPITCAGEACPRTVGFWGAQCAQRGNGSTKFTVTQLTAIAECIDSRSAFFNWAAGTDFDQFCRHLSTSNMTQRVQAKRQFAGVLANVCTDALNLQPSQGGKIFLDPATPVSCSGLNSTTIGALIDEVDAILAELEGQSLNSEAVKSRYGQLISCLDAINNGVNIPVRSDCEHGGTGFTGEGAEVGDEASVDAGASVELYRPSPNPFSGVTAFAYKVDATEASVSISVYDVAGRQIRNLVSGVQAAGQHTASWDGRNDSGVKATRGVYFVRTVIAGVKANTNRVLYLSE